jgi:hypothetical protein
MLPGDAHGLITHDHQKSGQLVFDESCQGKKDGVVNLVSIRLAQANNQDACVPVTAR